MNNPFHPSFGKIPPVFIGQDDIVRTQESSDLRKAFQNVDGISGKKTNLAMALVPVEKWTLQRPIPF